MAITKSIGLRKDLLKTEVAMSETDTMSLTALIKHLPTDERLKLRRRFEAVTEFWALRLLGKYGLFRAQLRCRYRVVYCTIHAPGIRLQIWQRVWDRLNA